MSVKILMPSLSPTMKEGNLEKWLVKVGDNVKAGDILAEIETDKATMEIEAVDEGKITNILVKEGTKNIAVNSTIAVLDGNNQESEMILNKSENKKKKKIIKNDKLKKKQFKENINDESNFIKQNINKEKIKNVSPFVNKIVKEKKLNIDSITGSGPNGRIIKRDLDQLNEKKDLYDTSIINFESIEPSSIRKIIAKKTTETKNTVPHFYLTINSEVDKLLKLKKYINNQNPDNNISINDILVKALAIAQYKNPETNVSWVNEKIIKYNSVDVSIAVALEDGLITPIIKKAETKGLIEISKEIKILIKKAKEGKLLPEDYNGGTISISNLGMYGINEFIAIINPPQSCILAIGSIQKKLQINNNKNVEEINFISSTLSADHRVLDGAIAAKLLKDFSDIIENPFDLWLQSKDMEII